MKLYATDLDGTLMRRIEGLSESEKARLVKLLESGFPLTFATGRVAPSGLKALGHPPFKLPLIGHGGAVVQEPGGKILFEKNLETPVIHEAIDLFKRTGLGLTVVLSPSEDSGRLWWKPEDFKGMDLFIESRAWDPSFRKLEENDDLANHKVVSLSCCGKDEDMAPVRDWVAGRDDVSLEIVHDPYLKGVKVGFLNPVGASKGAALEFLAAHLGISLSETCVMGDGYNDISLFKVAGRRIAPPGSCEEIVNMADEQLPEETSILDFLESEAARLAAT